MTSRAPIAGVFFYAFEPPVDAGWDLWDPELLHCRLGVSFEATIREKLRKSSISVTLIFWQVFSF